MQTVLPGVSCFICIYNSHTEIVHSSLSTAASIMLPITIPVDSTLLVLHFRTDQDSWTGGGLWRGQDSRGEVNCIRVEIFQAVLYNNLKSSQPTHRIIWFFLQFYAIFPPHIWYLLKRLTNNKKKFGGFGWNLPELVHSMSFSRPVCDSKFNFLHPCKTLDKVKTHNKIKSPERPKALR